MTWSFAFRNLFRNARRSVATGIAILVGFLGLVLLGGFIFRVENTLQAQAIYLKYKGHLSIFRKEGLEKFATDPSRFQLLPVDVEKIQGVLKDHQDEIDWTGSTLSGVGLLSNGLKSTPYSLLAVDVNSFEQVQKNKMVRTWAKEFVTSEDEAYAKAVAADPTAISISIRLGELLSLYPPYEKLSEETKSLQMAGLSYFGDLNAVNSELRGSHSTGSEFSENTSLIGSLTLAQDLFQTEGIQSLIVFLKDRTRTHDLLASLNQRFADTQMPYQAYPFDDQDISPSYVGAKGFLFVMSGFFIFLICGAVILSILNSLTMGILERTREIGTLRALGFKRLQISWMLTQESLWLTTLASLAGAVLALVISMIVNQVNFRFTPPGAPKSIQFLLTPEWDLFVYSYLLFMILSGVGSFVMSYWKMKSKVVDLLSDAGA
ncbi:MAG: FtsX-like permease family protein [Bdellovibrionaceae bacterium]|nr:FtsX-like permease family protein [Pseudobdellovibrionaceae bacterium]